MSGGRPLGYKRTQDARRQCVGKAKSTGKRCSNAPIPGGTVCRVHGGAAPQVIRKAQERLADLIDPDRLLRELVAVVYSDLREAFDEHGALKPVKDWPDGLSRAIASVKATKKNLTTGDKKVDDIVEIRLWDKIAGMTLLMRHLKMLTDKVEHTGKDGTPLLGDPREMLTPQILAEMREMMAIVESAAPQQALPPGGAS